MEPELERVLTTVSAYSRCWRSRRGLKILNALCEGERSVNDVVERVSSTQTNVSRHLNLMYSRGVLTRRRDGPMTFYAIADENVVTLCRTALCTNRQHGRRQGNPEQGVRRFMANG